MTLDDKYHPTFCTFEHLYPKGDPRRANYPGKGPSIVAACKHCNNTRSNVPFEDYLTRISTVFSWVLPNGELALHPHQLG